MLARQCVLVAAIVGLVAAAAEPPKALRGYTTTKAEGKAGELRKALRPSFEALSKSQDGRVGQRVALYLLHRAFAQLYGWTVRGLELGESGSTAADGGESQSLQDMLLTLEPRLESDGEGVDLDGLVDLAVSIEHVTELQATEIMKDVFNRLRYNVSGPLSSAQSQDALETYMIVFLGGNRWTVEKAVSLRDHWENRTAYWPATQVWMREVRGSLYKEGSPQNFAQVLDVALVLGKKYSSFNQEECTGLKQVLVNSWSPGRTTGRLRLVDFYKLGLTSSTWALDEKVEYLDALGSLDSSNTSSEMVIIPNYLLAEPNCLYATKLYSVCCRNECEDLMGSLESSLGGPTATPERIAELVGKFGSDTVEAPRTLTSQLLARLDEMALLHDGEVVIHGRLFAQWMHHAFPNECAYPHAQGKASPLTPEGWMDAEPSASLEERQRLVDEDTCGTEAAAEEYSGELPWSTSEELLHALPNKAEGARRRKALPAWCSLLVLAALATGLWLARQRQVLLNGPLRSALLGTAIGVVLLVVMPNKTLAALMLLGGFGANRLFKLASKQESLPVGKKCCV